MADETIAPAPPEPPLPPSAPPPATSPPAPGKGLAIASLVCSLVGFVPYLQIGAVVGIILGFVALNQMKGTAGEGKPFAKWGVILGFVSVGLYVLCCVIWFLIYGSLFTLGALGNLGS
jgi:uncharacterized membrane protein